MSIKILKNIKKILNKCKVFDFNIVFCFTRLITIEDLGINYMLCEVDFLTIICYNIGMMSYYAKKYIKDGLYGGAYESI